MDSSAFEALTYRGDNLQLFSVGEIPITDAVRSGCHSVQQLGSTLKCRTQCGSCIPELKKIIAGQLTLLPEGD